MNAAKRLVNEPSGFQVRTVTRCLKTADVLKKICIEGLNYLQTGIEMGMSDQQVRNLLDAFALELITIARTGLSSGMYIPFEIEESVLEQLRKIDRQGCAGMSISEIKRDFGGCTDGMADLVMRCFCCSSFGPVSSVVDEAYAAPRGTGIFLAEVLRTVNTFLKKEVVPVRESAIRLLFRKKKEEIVDAAVSLMRHCPQYEYYEEEGIGYYSLKWKDLGSVQKRVERILWEHKGEGLEKSEIEKEYLTRLRSCSSNESPKDILFKESDKIGGANGFWRWKEDGNQVIKDCRPLIQEYVVKKGEPVTLDEIVDFVNSLGVKLSTKSIETYLCSCCKHRRKEGDYILKEVGAPTGRGDITMEIVKAIRKSGRALTVKEIESETGIGEKRIYSALNKHKDIFSKHERAPKCGGCTFFINKEWDGCYAKEEKIGRKTPAYYEVVRRTAIQMLKGTESKSLPMTQLREKLSSFIPDVVSAKTTIICKLIRRYDDFKVTVHTNKRKSVSLDPVKHASEYSQPQFNLAKDWRSLRLSIISLATSSFRLTRLDAEKAVDAMMKIMGVGGTVDKESYFWLLTEMLHEWFKGDLSLRDLEYTRTILALTYERFLRNYYELKEGCVLSVSPGLGGVVKELQYHGMLPQRVYGDWKSDALSHIISVRGAVAHPDQRDTPGRILDNINEFIRLFLYTSSLL